MSGKRRYHTRNASNACKKVVGLSEWQLTRKCPCSHNEWMRVSKMRGSIVYLTCKVCLANWCTNLEWHEKCEKHFHGGCDKKDCPSVHIYRVQPKQRKIWRKLYGTHVPLPKGYEEPVDEDAVSDAPPRLSSPSVSPPRGVDNVIRDTDGPAPWQELTAPQQYIPTPFVSQQPQYWVRPVQTAQAIASSINPVTTMAEVPLLILSGNVVYTTGFAASAPPQASADVAPQAPSSIILL